MTNLFFKNTLSADQLKRRLRVREKDSIDLRGVYFRDATAIIHSYPFRRLKHKTQVFFSPKNDHICTRIEHVMHVATIAATICRALDLNGDLAWAIGVGHDLGHTPFGHLGETILEKLHSGAHSFKHEIYSLRVVDHLANHGKGLNLTYAVRDGIINHCGEKFEQAIEPDMTIKELSSIHTRDFYPSTWEGCVVRMADKIAYLGRDLEDALRLGIIEKKQLPKGAVKIFGDNNSHIINTLVNDLIKTSLETGKIGFSDAPFQAYIEMKNFNYQHIYTSPRLSEYHAYFQRVLTNLYSYLSDLFRQYGDLIERYKSEHNSLALRFGDYIEKMSAFYLDVDGGYDNLILDYIAGMSDDYAIDCISEIMVPKKFSVQFDGAVFL